MSLSANDGDLPEILVQRHKHRQALMRDPEDFLVSRIGIPFSDPVDRVSSTQEELNGQLRHAGVE